MHRAFDIFDPLDKAGALAVMAIIAFWGRGRAVAPSISGASACSDDAARAFALGGMNPDGISSTPAWRGKASGATGGFAVDR
jgi:hypothetical protein